MESAFSIGCWRGYSADAAAGEHAQGELVFAAMGEEGAAAPLLPLALLEELPAAKAPSNKHRGVSQHKGSRFESHIWVGGKQKYLGGYFCEDLAARAYDLAAVACRGQDAITNHPLQEYAQELEAAAAQQVPLDSVVAFLREQAKQLAKLDTSSASSAASFSRTSTSSAAPLATCMEPWELQLSEVISGQQSLGLFGSEAQAAAARDSALLAQDGLPAAPQLAFPLADYIGMLDAAQVEAAVCSGLLPMAALPAWQCAPEAAPRAAAELPGQLAASPFASYAFPGAPECGAEGHMEEAAGMAPVAPLPLPRRASVTPRHAGDAWMPFV